MQLLRPQLKPHNQLIQYLRISIVISTAVEALTTFRLTFKLTTQSLNYVLIFYILKFEISNLSSNSNLRQFNSGESMTKLTIWCGLNHIIVEHSVLEILKS